MAFPVGQSDKGGDDEELKRLKFAFDIVKQYAK